MNDLELAQSTALANDVVEQWFQHLESEGWHGQGKNQTPKPIPSDALRELKDRITEARNAVIDEMDWVETPRFLTQRLAEVSRMDGVQHSAVGFGASWILLHMIDYLRDSGIEAAWAYEGPEKNPLPRSAASFGLRALDASNPSIGFIQCFDPRLA